MVTFKEFQVIRRKAKKKEAYTAWCDVQRAAHNLEGSKREVNLALAWTVWFELKVQPDKVNKEDAIAHLQVIGSNGQKNMPFRSWEQDC